MSGVIRWYPYLVESSSASTEAPPSTSDLGTIREGNSKKRVSLLDVERLDFRSLVVCQQKDSRSFAKFASYLDFGRYLVKEVMESHRCFYEVIFGDTPQKPYFDLDIPLFSHKQSINGSIEQGPSEMSPEKSRVYARGPSSGRSNLPVGVPILPRREEPVLRQVNKAQGPFDSLDPPSRGAREATVCTSHPISTSTNSLAALSLEEADEAVRALTGIITQLITSSLPKTRDGSSDSRGQILVFTSHSDKKLSYHIIVDEWCFADSKECRYFHDEVIQRLPEKWRDIVDHGMYKSLQQLRITGCHKWNDLRTKTLSPSLSFKIAGSQGWTPPEPPLDSNHEYLLLLGCSLVTNTSDCHLLPSFAPPERPKRAYIKDVMTEMELDATSVDLAIELCAKMGQLTPTHPDFPYRLDRCLDARDGTALILLKRLRPSWCRVCQRIHENQHPYLLVVGRDRDVYLDCRRHFENQKLYLGRLGAMARSIDSDVNINSTACDNSESALVQAESRRLRSEASIDDSPSDIQSSSRTVKISSSRGPYPSGLPAARAGPRAGNETPVISWNNQAHHHIPIPCPPKDLFAQLQRASEERARPMKMELTHLSPRKGTIDSLGGWKLK